MKYLLALLSLLLLAACGSTPPQATPPAAPPIAWQHAGSTSYEARHPGLGSSDRYTSAAGWIDVYVYDLRRGDWARGVADPQFAAHFESTIAEVRLYAQRGAYVDLQVGPTTDSRIADQTFRSVNFRYARDGKPMRSTTWLTARNGRLLKYRISVEAAAGLDLDAVARQFIERNLKSDPTAGKQAHAPNRGGAEGAGAGRATGLSGAIVPVEA